MPDKCKVSKKNCPPEMERIMPQKKWGIFLNTHSNITLKGNSALFAAENFLKKTDYF